MNDQGGADGAAPGRPQDSAIRPLRRRLQRRRLTDEQLEHRRRRIRRRGRRAYIRSVYSLPSLATLGNAICGFASIYVTFMDPSAQTNDAWTSFLIKNHFLAAAYLLFIAMLFDALDGRLARFARHTTDFGGQLDSLADVISFGAAPAFLALQLFHEWQGPSMVPIVSRTIWAIGALYMSCAAIRLARFNVSNEHGEQHHFSFLGLPSPGAGGAVVAFILMQQDLAGDPWRGYLLDWAHTLSAICIWLIPPLVLATGLLMISNIRYPHMVNRYMRGKRSLGRLIAVVAILLLLVVAHRFTLGLGLLAYALWGPTSYAWVRLRRKALAK